MVQNVTEPIQTIVRSMMDSGMGVVLLGMLLLMVGATLFSPKKGKMTTGRFGGRAEQWKAAAIARQQRKQRQPHKVALKAGNVHIPHAQQSVTVTGAPDSGKTFSIIDPAIRSAIVQGFPILVYDFKGSQLEAHAAWAAAQGYEVAVFAPGQPYTGVCNPLDFLADETDSLMAAQLAQVLQKNTQREGAYRDNDFFTSAGTNLVEAVMLLAKLTPYPDLLMASKILNLTDLPSRIRATGAQGRIPSWTMESFSQLLASEGAEKQIAGIIATAQRTFKTFIGKQLVSSFCGTTTIPLDLIGKQLLFLQVDIQKRDTVSPLLAAVLHLIVTRNFVRPRKIPLIVALDELPTLYLPELPKWINEFRSYGFVALLGYQNFAQLQHMYGRELSRVLFAACGTKVFFNPKDRETANEFSGYLGEKDVKLYTRSRSHGRYGGSSYSEQYQKMPLLTPDQILKLDQGECVFINPAYKGGHESSIPLRLRVKIVQKDVQIQNRSAELWQSKVRDRLIQRMAERHTIIDLDQENEIRREMAERLFPLPVDESNSSSGQVQDINADITEDEYDEMFRLQEDYL
ncbi:type IV secretory system conjugative DNA transfer family protein [Egbenema bharatensis]|uniref:type IV secretory system conjugative DNA transfer family protein n=1 Tax=Egbenema bharatensis TaxID=3463334 RepID=UPI003A8C31CC